MPTLADAPTFITETRAKIARLMLAYYDAYAQLELGKDHGYLPEDAETPPATPLVKGDGGVDNRNDFANGNEDITPEEFYAAMAKLAEVSPVIDREFRRIVNRVARV